MSGWNDRRARSWVAAALVGAFLVALAVWGIGELPSANRGARPTSAAPGPSAPGAGKGPRLQADPHGDLTEYRRAKAGLLESYGWIDRKKGIVRIPVTRAMRLLLDRGFPVRAEDGHAEEEK